MKQLLFVLLAAASLGTGTTAYSQQSGGTNPVAKEKTKAKAKGAKEAMPAARMETADNSALPYVPTYSGKFAMGNPAHSRMVLNLIKDYETNLFSMSDAFADTAIVFFPDGTTVRGIEALTGAFKQMRTSEPDMTINVSAVVPMRSTDRMEDWVLVWGNSGGTSNRTEFHHIWRINRDGKVDYLRLYQGKEAQQ